ncbi:MAG: hypothetical protein ACLU9S_20355 [Oscillospiraceae bacterium]
MRFLLTRPRFIATGWVPGPVKAKCTLATAKYGGTRGKQYYHRGGGQRGQRGRSGM